MQHPGKATPLVLRAALRSCPHAHQAEQPLLPTRRPWQLLRNAFHDGTATSIPTVLTTPAATQQLLPSCRTTPEGRHTRLEAARDTCSTWCAGAHAASTPRQPLNSYSNQAWLGSTHVGRGGAGGLFQGACCSTRHIQSPGSSRGQLEGDGALWKHRIWVQHPQAGACA